MAAGSNCTFCTDVPYVSPASKVGTAWRFKREKIDQWMDANDNRRKSRGRE